jgi:hypothetical protein
VIPAEFQTESSSNTLETETEVDVEPMQGDLRNEVNTERDIKNDVGPAPASQLANQSCENMDEASGFECCIEELEATHKLIEIVKHARLGDTHCGLGEDFISWIRNPPTTPLVLRSIDERFSIDVYLAITNAS